MKKKLKIVLKEDIQNLGLLGEIKEVASGFARNYLVPQGLALYLKDPEAKQILKQAEEKKQEREKKIEILKEIASKLSGSILPIKAKVGQKGKLFGSIGAEEVVAKLSKDFKIKIDKKQIEMEAIKDLSAEAQRAKAGVGEKEILVKLGYGIEAKFKVKIEPLTKASKGDA